MLAAYHGHPETVRALLEHGADPNKANDVGQTPLAGAVFKGENEVLAALVDGGADPNAGSSVGRRGRADVRQGRPAQPVQQLTEQVAARVRRRSRWWSSWCRSG